MSETGASPFTARSVMIIIVALIVGFLAFIVLLAYAPSLRSGEDGGIHALSRSAVGFRGLYDLLDATGVDVRYARDPDAPTDTGLAIVTLQPDSDQSRVDALIDQSDYSTVLIVLPKWVTVPAGLERDRVAAVGTGTANLVLGQLEQLGKIQVRQSDTRTGAPLTTLGFPGVNLIAPEQVQSISGPGIEPVVSTPGGDIVLGQVGSTDLFILADPDLINNLALARPDTAEAAVRLIQGLNYDRGTISFDLVANGYGDTANMLRLMFEPPFLALTLCMLFAALLAGIQAYHRFGPARREPRAIAFGKRALVDNSAELLRIARREHLSAEHYVAMTRDAAVAAIGNPRGLSGAELDRWLDGLRREGEPFTTLAAQAHRARSRQDILNAAQALYQWRKAVTHEG